jgi:hypothetical protein
MAVPASTRIARDSVQGWRILVGIAILLSIAACTTYPPAPKEAMTGDYEYVIGPLDTVNIIVWRNPELSMVVPVRPDGKITHRWSTTSSRKARRRRHWRRNWKRRWENSSASPLSRWW